MASSSFSDLEITRDEIKQIGEALKHEEFRKLLIEYCNEINSLESQQKYQSEIAQLEKERGNDVTFINPQPGYVIKTSVNGDKKCFINICSNNYIGQPNFMKKTGNEGHRGHNWNIPHILAPSRDDIDKQNKRCVVYDIVFHPLTLKLAEHSKFREMINSIACESLEKNFDVKIDSKNLKFPKINYKGTPKATVIRKKIDGFVPEIKNEEFFKQIFPETNKNKKNDKKEFGNDIKNEISNGCYTSPKYSIKYRHNVDLQDFTNDPTAKQLSTIPKEIVVEINLPLLKTTKHCILNVTKNTISLISEKFAKYKLDLTLPYCVNENLGSAKFDQNQKQLVITLPVLRNNYSLSDSGISSSEDFNQKENEYINETTLLNENKHGFVNRQSGNCNSNDNEFVHQVNGNIEKVSEISQTLHEIPSMPDICDNNNTINSNNSFSDFEKNDELKIEKYNFDEKNNSSNLLNESTDLNKNGKRLIKNVIPINDDEIEMKSPLNQLDNYLDKDICYNLPEFSSHFINNSSNKLTVTFTLNVKNIESDSVDKLILDTFLYIKFSTLSSGFYRIYHAILFNFPDLSLCFDQISIEPWDNNLIIQLSAKFFENYQIGLDRNSLNDFVVDKKIWENSKEIDANQKKLNKIEKNGSLDSDDVFEDDDMSCAKQIKKLSFKDENYESKNSNKNFEIYNNEGFKFEKNIGRFTQYIKKNSSYSFNSKANPSLSESSGDELSSTSQSPYRYKGILKSRWGRSISESSVDDITLSTSVDNYNFSDSCIAEEKHVLTGSLKKTVRFSDNVSRQTFRMNSSILGQRKKNQRKKLNKKRAQERKLSESELSENDEKTSFRKEKAFSESELSESEERQENKIIKKKKERNFKKSLKIKDVIDEIKEEDAGKDLIQINFQNHMIFDLDM